MNWIQSEIYESVPISLESKVEHCNQPINLNHVITFNKFIQIGNKLFRIHFHTTDNNCYIWTYDNEATFQKDLQKIADAITDY